MISPGQLARLITVGSTPPVTQRFKVWNGTSWVAGTLKVWDGASWVAGLPKVWNGSAWA